ncbi:S-layer homology domain-containing protein [Eubacteriales bacterium SGI.150]
MKRRNHEEVYTSSTRRTPRGKRLLSWLLSIVMLLSLLPGMELHAHADYEDGAECPACGHYHWDEYMCGVCGACSEDCTQTDCWLENHPCPYCDRCILDYGDDFFCDSCGTCFHCVDSNEDSGEHCQICLAEDVYCSECRLCESCASDLDGHCVECGDCFLLGGTAQCEMEHSADPGPHCTGESLVCEECDGCYYDDEDLYCTDCQKCIECAKGQSHCMECGECFESEEYECDASMDEFTFNVCLTCCKSYGWHCEECEEHITGDRWCPTGGDGTHCAECAEDYLCPECGECALCDDDGQCDDCGMCADCCSGYLRAQYECECEGESGCHDSIDADHICSSCELAFCTRDQCEYCLMCTECCESDNQCEHGVCFDNEDEMEAHTCVECNECFDESELCPDCCDTDAVRCYDCCHGLSESEGCEHEVCMYGPDWEDHWCADGDHCIEEYCDVCGGCKACCDEERGDCDHDFTCPNDGGWDDHFCEECGECYDDFERCSECGLCVVCCAAAAEELGCEDEICIGSPEWQDHYCYQHDQCLDKCDGHGPCQHTNLSDWQSDAKGHWRQCADCSARLYNFPKQAHQGQYWTVTKPATTTATGERTLYCDSCKYPMKTEPIPVVSSHTCAGTGPFFYDDDRYHFRYCDTCGKKINIAMHDINNHYCADCGFCDVDAPEILDYSRDPKVHPTDSTAPVYMTLYVTAAGENLEYQWYEEAIEEGDGGVLLTGQTNARLRIKVQDYFGNDLTTCKDDNKTLSRFVCVVKNPAGEVPVTIDVNFECVDLYWQDMDEGTDTNNGHLLTCGDCGKTVGDVVPHRYNGTHKCVDCGHVKPVVIKSHPYKTSVKVQDDELGPVKMSFSVTAMGDGLTYQWYYAAYKDGDPESIQNFYRTVSDEEGGKTSSISIEIWSNACAEEPHYKVYCVVTDSQGNTKTSNTAAGEVLHTLAKGYTVQTYHPDGTPANEIPLYNDTYHWRVCIGSAHSLNFDDDINVFEKAEHSKVPLIVTAATTSSKAVVKDVCSICGWASEEYQVGDILPECTGTGGVDGMASPDGKHRWIDYCPLLPKGAAMFTIPEELQALYGGETVIDNTYPVGTSSQHAAQCGYCGATDLTGNLSGVKPGPHDFDKGDGWKYYKGIEPTEEHGAIMYRYDQCEDFYEAKVVSALPHEHKAGEMQHDKTQHWNACAKAECAEKLNTKGHTYTDWNWVTEPTETVEGIRTRSCTVAGCGYVQTQNVGVKTYSITVKDGKADKVSAKQGESVNITADSRTDALFNGWVSEDVTISDPSKETASFVMPAHAVTVTAKWTYIGGGSGGGGYSYYTIKATAGVNGSISPAGSVSVREGKDQTFTITPDKGYAVARVLVDGKDVGAVTSYTFQNVKGPHSIEAVFVKMDGSTQSGVFTDVPAGSYYEDAVIWAVDKGITTGTSATTFNPNGICTRAQAVTFLWRAAGSPAAKSGAMPFADVKAGSYCYDAVLWAVEQGITKGTSDTMFSPDATCTRAQIVTFLWRANGSPAVSGNSAFTDVAADAYYAAAVTWAEKNDITGGIGGGLFGSNNNCTRAQIVTFIYRSVK